MKPILLSHHPSCDKFGKNHTINVGKYQFCIGCFVGYPIAIIGILAIYYLNLVKSFDSIFFFIVGIVLISSFALSPLNLTKVKAIKIFQKVLIGIGSAFLFCWIWSLPNPFLINMLYFTMVFGFLLTMLNAYHGYGLYHICKKCEYSLDWQNCPGFKDIFECIEKHELKKISKVSNKN